MKARQMGPSVPKRDQNAGGWTNIPPSSSGLYWHWNEDVDCSPNPIHVGYSGTTGKCFVMRGQLGIENAIDCEKYGGLWMAISIPEINAYERAKRCQRLIGIYPVTLEGWESAGVALMDEVERLRQEMKGKSKWIEPNG